MADIYDQATEKEEQERELALAHVRNKRPLITPCGKCHNCGEQVEQLFCDVHCRDDWQLRNPAPRG